MLSFFLEDVQKGFIMGKGLNLPPGTKGIFFFEEHLSFPVFIYVLNEWEQTQVTCLAHNFNDNKCFTTLDICRWCDKHQINYQIVYYRYPLVYLFIDFKRFLCFLYIKYKGY